MVAEWLQSGCGVVASGCGVVAEWLRSGCGVAAEWLRSGCGVGAEWLLSVAHPLPGKCYLGGGEQLGVGRS